MRIELGCTQALGANGAKIYVCVARALMVLGDTNNIGAVLVKDEGERTYS